MKKLDPVEKYTKKCRKIRQFIFPYLSKYFSDRTLIEGNMININKILVFGVVLNCMSGCNPQKEYNAYILKQGYIPFLQPMATIGVGTLVRGTPKILEEISRSSACFPSVYNGNNTDLFQTTDVDLPEIAKKITFDAGVDANVIAANGTPLFKIKTDYHMVKSISVHVEGASIEYLDELAFADWVNNGMSSACKKKLEGGTSFIRQALRVDKMSFQFKNEAGGDLVLTAKNIKDMVDIEADVKWEISNNYTLTIISPKYIGYHLAKVSPTDPSSVAFVASSLTPSGDFKYVPVSAYHVQYRGLMIK